MAVVDVSVVEQRYRAVLDQRLRAAVLGKTLARLVHQFAVVTRERFNKDALKAGGQRPERSLLSRKQHRVDLVGAFPAMQPFEQDKSLVRSKGYSHLSHAQRLPTRNPDALRPPWTASPACLRTA